MQSKGALPSGITAAVVTAGAAGSSSSSSSANAAVPPGNNNGPSYLHNNRHAMFSENILTESTHIG